MMGTGNSNVSSAQSDVLPSLCEPLSDLHTRLFTPQFVTKTIQRTRSGKLTRVYFHIPPLNVSSFPCSTEGIMSKCLKLTLKIINRSGEELGTEMMNGGLYTQGLTMVCQPFMDAS